jgi:hypothetical protein
MKFKYLIVSIPIIISIYFPSPLFGKDIPCIKVELKQETRDLSPQDWTIVVEEIIQELQKIYHPNINENTLNRFGNTVFANDKFSIENLNATLQKVFGIGHLSVVRKKISVLDYVRVKRQNPGYSEPDFWSERGRYYAYLANPNLIKSPTLCRFQDPKNSFGITKYDTGKKIIPVVKAPPFNPKLFIKYKKFISYITNYLYEEKYDDIILDLRDNSGGRFSNIYHLLSRILGNNNPDIYPIYAELGSNQTLDKNSSREDLEQGLKNLLPTLPPFWDYLEQYIEQAGKRFKKEETPKIEFKKMIVLINSNTFSAAEHVAASLKNIFGKKVCLMGLPTIGSFETAGEDILLSKDFHLSMWGSPNFMFFSKKRQMLLNGMRLLPDIVHSDSDTIIPAAVRALDNSVDCNENAYYERSN